MGRHEITTTNTIQRLRAIPALRDATEPELRELVPFVDEVAIPAGRTVTREGGLGREAFVVCEGTAHVHVNGEPVGSAGPGEFVGELAMLDRGPRSATVVSATPMVLLVIGPQAWPSISGRPRVARAIAEGLAGRLRAADASLGGGR